MSRGRGATLWSVARGVLTAAGVTLAGMLIMAAAIMYLGLSEVWLTPLNQVLKLAAVLAGAYLAVGRGGERGLVTGAVTAALFMIAGYACYCALGGMSFSWSAMLTEILVGGAIGGAFGAILANMKPENARSKPARAKA